MQVSTIGEDMTLRNETKYHRYNYEESSQYWDRFSGFDPEIVNSFYSDEELSIVFVGDDRPNWRYLIRNQDNAVNVANAWRATVKVKPTKAWRRVTQYVYEFPDFQKVAAQWQYTSSTNHTIGVAIPAAPSGSSIAQDMAKARFVSNARSAMSPTQALTTLGELRETIQTILHPAQALRRGLGDYLSTLQKKGRSLKRSSKRKKRAVVAETWLEYALGWRPLLLDIDNNAKALAQFVSGIHPLANVRGRGRHDVVFQDETATGSIAGCTVQYRTVERESYRSEFYGKIDLSVDPVPTLASAFGLRPHDVIPSVWELIPYSFVVDYFTNIGDMISCASFSTTYLRWWGNTDVGRRIWETKFVADTTVDPSDMFTLYEHSLTPGYQTKVYETLSRSVSPFLVPSLRIKLPGSTRAVFNMAALLAQRNKVRNSFA